MPDSLFRLDTKIAAIIGAGSGIGAAVAAGAARQGADVICLDIDEISADRVARGIGGRATSAGLDIRDALAVVASFDGIVRERGGLDIVVCTPSINVRKPIL